MSAFRIDELEPLVFGVINRFCILVLSEIMDNLPFWAWPLDRSPFSVLVNPWLSVPLSDVMDTPTTVPERRPEELRLNISEDVVLAVCQMISEKNRKKLYILDKHVISGYSVRRL